LAVAAGRGTRAIRSLSPASTEQEGSLQASIPAV
jgi:hypothetical protein